MINVYRSWYKSASDECHFYMIHNECMKLVFFMLFIIEHSSHHQNSCEIKHTTTFYFK